LMRAVLLTGYGGVDKLELGNVPEPVAGPGEVKVRLAALAQAVAAGKLTIPIAKRLPLAQIREAHTLVEQGADGKVVLRIR